MKNKFKALSAMILVLAIIFSCFISANAASKTPDGYVTVSFEDFGIRIQDEIDDGFVDFEKPLGTIISATKVPYYEGENIAQVTVRLLESKGMGYSSTGTLTDGFYLSAIKNFNNSKYGKVKSFGEFDAGPSSGWMLTLNGWFINMSTSAFEVEDGDIIRWRYTCQLGADIGCDWSNPSAKVTGINIDKKYGTLSPEFSSKIKSYTLTVPETVEAVCLEAQLENAWSTVTYSVGKNTYKPLQEIPVKDGTKIVISTAFSEYAGGTPTDTDEITITIKLVPIGSESDEEPVKNSPIQKIIDFFNRIITWLKSLFIK